MSKLLGGIALCFLVLPSLVHAECADGVSNGNDSYRFALRSLREPTFAKAREYMVKAADAAEKAMKAADTCDCDEAVYAFRKARNLAREAVKTGDSDTLKGACVNVMDAAKAGVDEAEGCK